MALPFASKWLRIPEQAGICLCMNAKFPFDIIGFDLDGTLIDTGGDLTAAVNHVLDSIGRPTLSNETVKQHIGGGAKLMLQKGLEETGGIPDDDFKPLYRQMLRFYEENVSVYSRPFDGALALLDQLDTMDVKYAVVTNKFENLAVKLLTDLGLAHRMVCILGVDTLGRENAKPSGVPSVAVSFGFLHGPVEDMGADAVIDHFDELIDTLHQL
jgi:phosphoglycolate phosphatase